VTQGVASALLAYLLAALAVYVLLRWLHRPLAWLLVVLGRGLLGGAAIWGLDYVGRAVGVHVALNPVSALVAGFLGVPGVALLLVLGAMA
jgi:inhibitor of the pro-sigma K processing machinery